jgi:hypothetical protein
MFEPLSPTAAALRLEAVDLNINLPAGVLGFPRTLRGLRVVGTPSSAVLRELATQCPLLEEVCWLTHHHTAPAARAGSSVLT